MSSACRSLRLKRAISAALSSSLARMMAITSSMLSSTICRPSRMWMRSSTLSGRCCVRRVIVVWRKAIHSSSICRSDFCTGLAVEPDHGQVDGRGRFQAGVCQQRVIKSCCGVLPSWARRRRAGASLLDSSRTTSSTASMLALSWSAPGSAPSCRSWAWGW